MPALGIGDFKGVTMEDRSYGDGCHEGKAEELTEHTVVCRGRLFPKMSMAMVFYTL